MSYQFCGILSGVLGLFSGAWYLVRIFRREVHPHITSWLLWTLIALAMLASYWSAGAKGGDHIWVAVVGLVNPLLITLVAWRVGSWNKPDHLDWARGHSSESLPRSTCLRSVSTRSRTISIPST